MRAVVVANGELQASPRLRRLWESAGLRIAANGGARNARVYLETAPQVVIGDLDSLDETTRTWLQARPVEFLQYPPAKDETDLELALNLAQARGAGEVTVLAAYGGRADQSIANVLLLSQAPGVRMVDAASELWVQVAAEGKAALAELVGKPGDIISLIPLDERVEGIVTQELEYPLQSETLTRGSTRGVSNVMRQARARVTWQRGMLLIVHLFSSM
jgi:thiamine pyrophosphokinase